MVPKFHAKEFCDNVIVQESNTFMEVEIRNFANFGGFIF